MNIVSLSAFIKENDGKAPKFAWPGGYPLFYVCEDNSVLCADCVNNEPEVKEQEFAEWPDAQWHVVATDIHWEGPAMACDHCGGAIESAYGDPDAEAASA